MNRRDFVMAAGITAASAALPRFAWTQNDLQPIWSEIEKRREESIQRLQNWIKQPSIAAEKRGMEEGCNLMMQMLRDAGFDQVSKIPTDGSVGDAGQSMTSTPASKQP